jgi:hypothetical protein
MLAPFIGPALGNIMQVAWVTPDLERSLEMFREIYRVPEFLVLDADFPAVVFGETGPMKLRLALANVDAIQLELIQPIGLGVNRLYRDVLPADGSFANVFHHVCVKVGGPVEDWEPYVASLGAERPVAFSGDLGDHARVCYTDERATIGMYVEHVWFSPEQEAQMASAIPTYQTK